ncbi:hypothetical protein SAMN05216267_103723 [Actinacidiphila rubida]|uniref:Uncharacterized protein n=1 Tax=Actinacidiphila rubida TaxID=310780 RepID=A0A1H8RUV4_9ACTN|nr:hypothetical protein [Actinacidiphila rubida]SEO70150.1 hypothetical protein SAMN05216267_103723 [Actinacidiphila rubida]
MFGYELQNELQKAHRSDLQREAEQWRLARDAKAARTSERRARRTGARTASRGSDAEASGSSLGRLHRALHPHSAA